MGYFPHVHDVLPLTYISRIDHHSTILPLRIQDLDSLLEYFDLGVQFARERVTRARLPAHANLPGGLPGYFPLVHGALLLTSSSRIGHHSMILPLHIQNYDSHEYFALGVWFAREQASRTDPSACQPTGDFAGLLPARARRITIDFQFSDRPL